MSDRYQAMEGESPVIVYLMSGKAHAPYLLTSLQSLRRHWRGKIIVHAWPDSWDVIRRIGEDSRLGIETVRRDPKYRNVVPAKNAQFVDKICLLMDGSKPALYLDADTLVHGCPFELISELTCRSFLITQFNAWVTCGNKMRSRIERLRQFPEINQTLVDLVTSAEYPSPNGGIVGARPNSPVLKTWLEWTLAAKDVFIADETVLQLLLPMYPLEIKAATGGRWNLSPNEGMWPKPDAGKDAVIIHGHGDCFSRPQKSPNGVRLWLAEWQQAWEQNLGYCHEWARDCIQAHKHMRIMPELCELEPKTSVA